MGTTVTEIWDWLDRGKKENCAYMFVCADTFDWSDYPVYCKNLEEAKKTHERLKAEPMTRIMECYNFSMDINSQLQEKHAFHLE